MEPVGSNVLFLDRLVKHYPIRTGLLSKIRGQKELVVHALDDVSLSVAENETVGIIGESGSGKTTLGLTALRLVEPTSGRVLFDGKDITGMSYAELRSLRRRMQIVFQDPVSSLDPRKKVFDIVVEPLRAAGISDRRVLEESALDAIRAVGLSDPQLRLLPYQFSGGQKQRISIARAIVAKPKFIVLDEPTSSLDASVQAQILTLLQKLQAEFRLSYMLITHNFSVAKYMSDRVAVMYLGKIVELGTTEKVATKPFHPYTQLLLSSVLEPGNKSGLPEVPLEEKPVSNINPPMGCRFNTRCPYAQDICFKREPPLLEVESNHYAACHFAGSLHAN
jgi:oligopeptide/dipeptide ABC transporter ATP-binding protein